MIRRTRRFRLQRDAEKQRVIGHDREKKECARLLPVLRTLLLLTCASNSRPTSAPSVVPPRIPVQSGEAPGSKMATRSTRLPPCTEQSISLREKITRFVGHLAMGGQLPLRKFSCFRGAML